MDAHPRSALASGPFLVALFLARRWRSLALIGIVGIGLLAVSGCAAPTLTEAARSGDNHRLVELINSGADINDTDSTGFAPLHWAATNGLLDTARVLVEHRAEIDVRDADKATPMMNAIYYRQDRVAQYLLNKGAAVNATNKNGWTALMFAASNRDASAAEILIAHGADVNLHEEDKPTALAVSHSYGAGNVESVLKRHGAK